MNSNCKNIHTRLLNHYYRLAVQQGMLRYYTHREDANELRL